MGKVNTIRSKKKDVCGGSGEALLTGKKRKNEGALLANEDVNAKRSKKDAKNESSQWLEWDEEDEIRVLQGLIDFKALTGKDPFGDVKETYEFIKEYIIFEAYSDEFLEKMRSLKKKLMDQRRKAKEPSSSERYDQRSSELLTLIWGNDWESAVEKPKSSKKVIKPKEEKQGMIHGGEKWFEDASMVRQVVSLGVDEDSLTRKWDAVPMKKKNKMDQKWSVLRTKKLESVSQKAKFLKELVSVIVEASSSRLM